MSSVDRTRQDRQIVEPVLRTLEALADRLDAGEVLPNTTLGDIVERLRGFEDVACDSSRISGNPVLFQGGPADETSRILLVRMQWALEALERREAGAAGAFVLSAREYIRVCRDHMFHRLE